MVILLLTVDTPLVVPAFVYKMSFWSSTVVASVIGHNSGACFVAGRMTYEIQVLIVSNNRLHHVRILDIFVEGGSYRGRMFSGLLQTPIVAMGL